jgi:hypothetical protein
MADYEKPENLAQKNIPLTLQEGVIGLGIMKEKGNATTDYQPDTNGIKTLNRISPIDTGMLAEKFQKDPSRCLAFARNNLLAIMQDTRLSKTEKLERLSRYLDAHFALQLKLDHAAFPADDKIRYGVPDYIPDGLSDMGSDSTIDPSDRFREKIRVGKEEIFQLAKPLFTDIFSHDFTNWTPEKIKRFIVDRIGVFIYNEMPYHEKQDPFPNPSHSVTLVSAHRDHLAVCRHHAMYGQVLLQACGITSRLLKCNVDFHNGRGSGGHVANLVRIQGKWHLVDYTNPDYNNGVGKVFHAGLSETDIDLNKHTYTWNARRKHENEIYTYTSRNNMYYRIRDNKKDKI